MGTYHKKPQKKVIMTKEYLMIFYDACYLLFSITVNNNISSDSEKNGIP